MPILDAKIRNHSIPPISAWNQKVHMLFVFDLWSQCYDRYVMSQGIFIRLRVHWFVRYWNVGEEPAVGRNYVKCGRRKQYAYADRIL